MDDGFLIRQTLSGKRNAFRMLVVRYQRPLFRFLGGFGLGQAIAEELAQETFLRAFRNLPGYDAGKAKFSSWLFTIAKNLALNERARSHQRLPHADVAAAEAESLARDSVPSAHEALESGERRLRVQRALQRLPEDPAQHPGSCLSEGAFHGRDREYRELFGGCGQVAHLPWQAVAARGIG